MTNEERNELRQLIREVVQEEMVEHKKEIKKEVGGLKGAYEKMLQDAKDFVAARISKDAVVDFQKESNPTIAAVREVVREELNKAKETGIGLWNWLKLRAKSVRNWFNDHTFWALYVPVSLGLMAVATVFSVPAGIAAGAAIGVLTMSIAEFGISHDNYALLRDYKSVGGAVNEDMRTNEVVKMGTSLIFASCAIAKLIAYSPFLGIMAGIGALVVGILACVATDNKRQPAPAAE